MQKTIGPDFVCIGAQKAGTTWLYDNLFSHPELELPPIKELHYFNTVCPNEELLGIETAPEFNFAQKIDQIKSRFTTNNIRWLFRFYNEQRSDRYYTRLFDLVSPGKKSADFTPAYSTLDERGVRYAHKTLKANCKVFIILRNPVERIWSGLKMAYRWRQDNVESTDIDQLLIELNSPTNRLRTDYNNALTLWSRYFGDRFKVFLYDDLRENPEQFIYSVEKYVGISQYIDRQTLHKLSNADQKKISMPSKLRTTLNNVYLKNLDTLDEFSPGLKNRWSKQEL